MLEGVVRLPQTLQETVGKIFEGAGGRYEGPCDRLFEDVEDWTLRGGGEEEGHSSGGQVEPDHFPSGFLSGFCGG